MNNYPVTPQEPIEDELRQGLRETQRKVEALQRVFPASNKAEKSLERDQVDWMDRLKGERTTELRKAIDDENHKQISEKFDRLEDGLRKAVGKIRNGQEPDLTFTLQQQRQKDDAEPER